MFQSFDGFFTPIRVFVKSAVAGAVLFMGGCVDPDPRIPVSVSESDRNWLAAQIFQNECSGRESCLVHWNEGEAFPSLGIGHFIWYPEGVQAPFVESFPLLLKFLKENDVRIPDLLRSNSANGPRPPWETREQWLDERDGAHSEALRKFLLESRDWQALFIVSRMREALTRVLGSVAQPESKLLMLRVRALAQSPGGVYALVDYVNFKGEGLSASEMYNGQGWGLLQVLQGMEWPGSVQPVTAFRESAAAVLTRRAENAPRAIERDRWLRGWLARLDTYQEPSLPVVAGSN